MKNKYPNFQRFTAIRMCRLTYAFLLGVLPVFLFSGISTAQVTHRWASGIGGIFDDEGLSTAVDNSGNVYITGNFLDVADFDPSGNTANLTCQGAPDIFLAKYDAAGNYLWAINMGYFTPAYGEQVVTDNAGNVYITGYFMDSVDFDPSPAVANRYSSGIFDVFVAKYDPSGNYLWAVSFGGPSVDWGYSMAVDNLGNVYVCGSFLVMTDFDPSGNDATIMTFGGSPDIFLAKYDANGNYMWAHGLGGVAYDEAKHITLDASANIYMTGYFQGTADFNPPGNTDTLHSGINSNDIFIAKYDSAGNYLWAKGLGGDYDDRGFALAVDADGNTYVTGFFQWVADFDPSGNTASLTANAVNDIFIAKYDPSGNYRWARNIGGSSQNEGSGVAVDAGYNVYLTGYFQGTADFDPSSGADTLVSNGAQDIFLAAFDSAGNYRWARNFGGQTEDRGHAVTTDPAGDIYLAGYFQDTADFNPTPDTTDLVSNGGKDIFIARYGICGIPPVSQNAAICAGYSYQFGSQILTSPGVYTEIFTGTGWCDSAVTLTLTVDSADNSVSVSGATITANAAGALYQWINCTTSTPIAGETGQSYTATANGMYAVIVTENNCTDTSACVQISGLAAGSENPALQGLQVFPNPAAGYFQVTSAQATAIRVTDMSGKILYTQLLQPGNQALDLRHLQEGIYLLLSDDKQQVKIIITR